MTYQEVYQQPEVLALRPQLESLGINYKSSVEKAVDAAHKSVPVSRISGGDKEQIIAYVINFLTKLVDEKMATEPKTKGGKLARFFWGIFRIFGGKERVIKEANKL